MNHLNILLLSVLAFIFFALAMERHQADLFGRQLDSGATKMLRAAGWVLLCASLAVAVRQPLWSLGLVAWFGYLSAGAGAVFGALVLAQRRC
jgi:hypothetical protein